MKLNYNKNQKILFPENTAFVISKIMKKYKIEGTAREILEKIWKGEKTKGGETAKIVKEIAEGKISHKNSPLEIQKRLNIPLEKAKKIFQELQKEILIFVKKIPIEKEGEKLSKTIKSPLKAPEVPRPEAPKTKKKQRKKDVYRESY